MIPRSLASRSMAVFMTALLAFQSSLTGGSALCVMPPESVHATTGIMANAMPLGNADSGARSPSAGHASARMPAQMPEKMPCDQHTSLPMCQAMGPCIVALAAAPASAHAAPFITPSRTIAMTVIAPPSWSFPPEPPPPRA